MEDVARDDADDQGGRKPTRGRSWIRRANHNARDTEEKIPVVGVSTYDVALQDYNNNNNSSTSSTSNTSNDGIKRKKRNSAPLSNEPSPEFARQVLLQGYNDAIWRKEVFPEMVFLVSEFKVPDFTMKTSYVLYLCDNATKSLISMESFQNSSVEPMQPTQVAKTCFEKLEFVFDQARTTGVIAVPIVYEEVKIPVAVFELKMDQNRASKMTELTFHSTKFNILALAIPLNQLVRTAVKTMLINSIIQQCIADRRPPGRPKRLKKS